MPKFVIGKPPRIYSCADCASSSCADPETGDIMSGKLFTQEGLRLHRRDMAQTSIANALLEAGDIEIPSTTSSPSDTAIKSDCSSHNPSTNKRHDMHATAHPYLHSEPVTLRPSHISTNIPLTPHHTYIERLAHWYQLNPEGNNTLRHSLANHPLEFQHPVLSDKISYELSRSTLNATFINHEYILRDILHKLQHLRFEPNTPSVARLLLQQAEHDIEELEALKKGEWERQLRLALAGDSAVDMAVFTRAQARIRNRHPVILNSDLGVAASYLFSNISLRNVQWQQRISQRNLLLALKDTADLELMKISNQVIEHPKSLLRHLELLPVSTTYICCPACFELYSIPTAEPTIKNCQYRATPSSNVCGAALFQPTNKARKDLGLEEASNFGGRRLVPIKTYTVQDINLWIGRLYSRSDIEELLKKDPSTSSCGDMYDIWDGSMLANFHGPDGKKWFDRPKGEGRLLFAINYDGFNPYGNKQAGKSVTISGIYLVCLNLPRAIRYDLANICLVAVVPGPHEPSQERINPVLQPVVDQLDNLWFRGVFLSATHLYPLGRTVRGAIVVGIHDRLAADKINGFDFRTQHHCNQCWSTKSDIDNLKPGSWRMRTIAEHRKLAQIWKSAPSEDERQKIFNAFHVKYSELLHLDYWDPIRNTTMDSMHAFERLFAYHTHDIWGMDHSMTNGEGKSFRYPTTNLPSTQDMKIAKIILYSRSISQLKSLPANVLQQLCGENGLRFGLTAQGSLTALKQLRETKGWGPDFNAEQIPSTPSPIRELFNTASKSAMERLSKSKLVEIYLQCVPNKKHRSVKDVTEAKLNKSQLLKLIHTQRIIERILDPSGQLLSVPPKTGPMAVLGRERLRHVRDVISRIRLPPWMTPSPRNPGNAKWGKFTATQWHTFGTVILPFALLSLWASEESSSREYKMLANYLHLVCAIELAVKRVSTEKRRREFSCHMHKYVEGLLELYLGMTLTSYHHRCCYHYDKDMERFGPSHAHRCFSFEFFNGILQHIATNSKLGELELTIFERFCMAQNLHALFQSEQLPSDIANISSNYRRFFKSVTQKTFLHEEVIFEEETSRAKNPSAQRKQISPADRTLLYLWQTSNGHTAYPTPHDAIFYRSLTRRGQDFQTGELGKTSSEVAFKISRTSDWGARIIQRLFSCRLGSSFMTFVILKPFSSTLAQQDLVRNPDFSDYGARIFKKSLGSDVLIHCSDILGHINVYPAFQIDASGNSLLIHPAGRVSVLRSTEEGL